MKKFIVENVKNLCQELPVSMMPSSYEHPWDFDEDLDIPCQVTWMLNNCVHQIKYFPDGQLKYTIVEFKKNPEGVNQKITIFCGECTLKKRESLQIQSLLTPLLDRYFNYIADNYKIN